MRFQNILEVVQSSTVADSRGLRMNSSNPVSTCIRTLKERLIDVQVCACFCFSRVHHTLQETISMHYDCQHVCNLQTDVKG